MSIRGVLFDLDNTLYDRDVWFLQWAAWFLEAVAAIEEAKAREALQFLIDVDQHGYAPRRAVFEAISQRFDGLAETAEQLLAAFYQHQVEHVVLEEGATVLIEALRARGIPFGIVSNGSENQLKKLERMGLNDLSCCLISELVGMRKPDQAIFLAAAERLGLPCHDILFVGDHPELDIAAAKAAGTQTAWLRRGASWPPGLARADHEIDGLNELLALVEAG